MVGVSPPDDWHQQWIHSEGRCSRFRNRTTRRRAGGRYSLFRDFALLLRFEFFEILISSFEYALDDWLQRWILSKGRSSIIGIAPDNTGLEVDCSLFSFETLSFPCASHFFGVLISSLKHSVRRRID